MGVLIRGGRVIDAATNTDKVMDLYLDDGVIQEIGENLQKADAGDRVIDADGLVVMPGIVDLHVHFRDPGQEYKETIETGSRAAARGGVTTVVTMPNTTPVIDEPDRVRYVQNKAAQLSQIHVLQAGAMTRGEQGKELSDIAVYGREGESPREKGTIGYHSLRAGNIPSSHTVFFGCMGERLEITHHTYNWECFARGACDCAAYLEDKGPGFYSVQDVLNL